LINLLGNAIKFTEAGEVLVSVSSQIRDNGRYLFQFAVKDTGIGISAAGIDRLFKSFSQVDASTTRKYGGTGLGLAISKQLAGLMGGTMWVASEPGQGSAFCFTIAMAAAQEEEIALLPLVPSASLAGKTVLVVDDNETNRRILLYQLNRWQMKPVSVASGPEALALLAGRRFDLAILDMNMPEMDGLELADTLCETYKGMKMPLVMLTSLGEPLPDSRYAHFAAFINKPVKPAHLFKALSSVFDSAEASPIQVRHQPLVVEESRPLSELYPLRILLAEDNAVNQKVALQMLARLGYRADVVGNGLEALQAHRQRPYDLILMDVQMPEMDGAEATVQIRRNFPAHKQPLIVAMTANALQGDREKYLDIGMDEYISKPVRMERLTAVLAQMGAAHQRQHEEKLAS
jgi:CheY-like chemotaxis protein